MRHRFVIVGGPLWSPLWSGPVGSVIERSALPFSVTRLRLRSGKSQGSRVAGDGDKLVLHRAGRTKGTARGAGVGLEIGANSFQADSWVCGIHLAPVRSACRARPGWGLRDCPHLGIRRAGCLTHHENSPRVATLTMGLTKEMRCSCDLTAPLVVSDSVSSGVLIEGTARSCAAGNDRHARQRRGLK